LKRIGVLIIGMNGATANTVIAGAVSKSGDAKSFGSIIQTEAFKYVDFPIENQFAFGGWDIARENAYVTALRHKIIPHDVLEPSKSALEELYPMKAVSNEYDVAETDSSDFCVHLGDFREAILKIKTDIQEFKVSRAVDDCVVIYLAAPLKHVAHDFSAVGTVELEKMIRDGSPYLTSAMIYALASIESNCAFVDFTPNITLEVPGIIEMAERYKVPLAGRDGNTGQSLLKTVIGEMLRIRNLKLIGWYSTNILGNNDGLVLSRDEHRTLKLQDKLGVLDPIVGYQDFEHVVDISYYRPRGDNKESWDNIDFSGWLGLPMSMKINWIGRDSILAAPLILDLVKHLCHSIERGHYGVQEHLAMYFKHPLRSGVLPFVQAFEKLKSHYTTCLSGEKEN
jgi:myo-inositol-1-phosphate synthase